MKIRGWMESNNCLWHIQWKSTFFIIQFFAKKIIILYFFNTIWKHILVVIQTIYYKIRNGTYTGSLINLEMVDY